MNTKDILYELRTKKGLSQDELAAEYRNIEVALGIFRSFNQYAFGVAEAAGLSVLRDADG